MTLRIGRLLEIDRMTGTPLQVGERRLVPVARTVTLVLGRRGSPLAMRLVWTRPVAVEVAEPSGSRCIRIVRPVGRIGLGLLGAILLMGWISRRARRGAASRPRLEQRGEQE